MAITGFLRGRSTRFFDGGVKILTGLHLLTSQEEPDTSCFVKRLLLFFLIAAPVVALLAFGLTRDARELPSTMVGKKAPSFALKSLEGKTVTLDSLLGKKILVNFWATWCGPCYQEHPVLKAVRKKYPNKDLEILGVVYQDNEKNVREYLKENGAPFTVLFDPDNKTGIDYGVGGVPETFFIDQRGIIREKHAGILTQPYVEFILSRLSKP